MNRVTIGALSLILVTRIMSSVSLADSWAAPTPRIFASQHGSFGFKVLEPRFGRDSKGVLFRLNKAGQEEVVWSRQLVNIPYRVYPAEDGRRVVTISTYGSLGRKHTVVVYDEQGQVLGDYRFDQLLPTLEQMIFVESSISSSHWSGHVTYGFSTGQFLMTLHWPKDAAKRLSRFQKLVENSNDKRAKSSLERLYREYRHVDKEKLSEFRVIRFDLATGKVASPAKPTGKDD